MYGLVREVHAACALLLLGFVVLYALTGYPLVHGDDFQLEAEPTVTEVGLDLPAGGDDETYDYLSSTFEVWGRRAPVELLDGGTRVFLFERPGWTVRFEVAPDAQSATMRTREGSLLQRTIRLHQVTGFSGGAAYFVWGLMVDLVSLAMLVFAFSGIYLWYARTRDRRLGWALLGVSWGLAVGAMVYFALAP